MKSWPLLIPFAALSVVPHDTDAIDAVFDSNGVEIRYVTAGEGEPVVLLHGWMSDGSMWGRLDTNPATEEYQLIAVDLRGHGKSGKPHEPEQYGPEMAEDVVRLLDHLELKKAHLVGYSMGAIVAGKIAATHPDRVLSLVFGGQAPVLTTDVKEVKVDAREIEVFAKAVEEGKGLGSYLIEVTPADKPKMSEDYANALAKVLYDGKDVKAFAAAGRGIKHLDVTLDQLARCSAPILFIHGSKEAEATKLRAALIVEELGRGDIKVIEGADHMTTLLDPEFGDTIDEFLEKVGRQ
ncbi:MAG: alpha/beta hydrolase [Planctomycetes bacterium]|nr:alpha/beta hydrolase [Planctomycetota bacterium]